MSHTHLPFLWLFSFLPDCIFRGFLRREFCCFAVHMFENIFTHPPNLSGNLARYRIIRWKLFFLRILRMFSIPPFSFLHPFLCHLIPLYGTCLLSLGYFRISLCCSWGLLEPHQPGSTCASAPGDACLMPWMGFALPFLCCLPEPC